MTRLRNVPLALAALAVSAGVALGFNALPLAAGPGLERAGDASGRTLPARPASIDTPDGAPVAEPEILDPSVLPDAADLPDAASHGAAVSAVATADDPTPDTNFGADVSAVARDNHGQDEAEAHKPADAGKPSDVGKPDGAGKPSDPGKPDEPGKP
jgi:hypothetical protein